MCSRYVNVGRVHVRPNGEPLEKVDCVKGGGSLPKILSFWAKSTYRHIMVALSNVRKMFFNPQLKKCLYDKNCASGIHFYVKYYRMIQQTLAEE